MGVGLGGGVPGRRNSMWEYFGVRRSIVLLRSLKRAGVADVC